MTDDIEPIVVEVELDGTPHAAFDAFVSGFGDWWPVLTHSLSRNAGTHCEFATASGGRILETATDGTQHLWGSVTSVEPGRCVRFTWHPGRGPDTAQWVEVSFAATGGGCRARLVHGGWERLDEVAPLLRNEYLPGWRRVFGECFADYARRAGLKHRPR